MYRVSQQGPGGTAIPGTGVEIPAANCFAAALSVARTMRDTLRPEAVALIAVSPRGGRRYRFELRN